MLNTDLFLSREVPRDRGITTAMSSCISVAAARTRASFPTRAQTIPKAFE